jgi:hypothetical protein
MLGVMYLLTRQAFRVAFEWRRLAQLAIVIGGIAAVGDLFLPTHGLVGFLTRAGAFLAIPLALLLTGFAHRQELTAANRLARRARKVVPR